MPRFVPDTSVLVDGRLTELVQEEKGCEVLVPLAALAELEAQANRGDETGFAGLDELRALQDMALRDECSLRFVGRRPTADEIDRADTGAIDALIRDAALEHQATLVTSDRVQAYAASAHGVAHVYQRPIVEDAPIEELGVSQFFEEDIMSVHLRADCRPMAKRGTPGKLVYEPIGVKALRHQEVRALAKECIEFARRDYHSFIEKQRHGCTVLQVGPMRITIAQPPFSDGLEITAVRPVRKTTLADYDLDPAIVERIEDKSRGIFIAGSPGGGKSTFVAAIGEHLHGLARVVKTMEQPRDLQVPAEITQYGALDGEMAWTGEIMLLVRPDHVLYDEVRTTDDFRVFADMRLAGIGLFGVTHANRPIDAIQRLVGRVELGMIPQVVDTVVFIDKGGVEAVLEVSFTVRTPAGMTQDDLARPVVIVKDFANGEELYELYTYGEQVVVMPLSEVSAPSGRGGGASRLAASQIKQTLARFVRGPVEVEVHGDRATILVPQALVPQLIGKGGKTIQSLERRIGIRLDVRADDAPSRGPGGPPAGGAGHDSPPFKATGSNVFLVLGPAAGGRTYEVRVEDAVVGECLANAQGRLRFKGASPAGRALKEANKKGLTISCHPID